MRVLVVDAFAGSRSGRDAFVKYERLVRSAFQTVEPHEQGRTEVIVRHYRKLEVRMVLRIWFYLQYVGSFTLLRKYDSSTPSRYVRSSK